MRRRVREGLYRRHLQRQTSPLHTLSQHGADSHVIFADLVKAYDTVDRELLWKIMARYGCPEELTFVLRKLYTNITVQLKGFGKGFTIPSTVGETGR